MNKLCLLIVSALLLAGCGKKDTKKPGTVDVSGKVMLNGSPLAGATVQFIHKDHASRAVTNAEGKYVLPAGAMPGKNKVTISRFDKSKLGGEGDPDSGLDAGQAIAADPNDPAGAKKMKAAQDLPAKYSDPAKTILEVNVPDGGKDDANFTLTTK